MKKAVFVFLSLVLLCTTVGCGGKSGGNSKDDSNPVYDVTDSKNDYRPRPYDKDEDGYARVISKLDGSWTGSDLNVDYSFMYR